MKLFRAFRGPGHTVARTLAILPLLALMQMALVLSAVHHHPEESGAERCSVCVVSHAPAHTAHELRAPQPHLSDAGVAYLAPVFGPRERTPLVAFGRSPPES